MEADYKVYPINVFKEAFEKTNSEIKFDDAFPNIVLSNGRLNMVIDIWNIDKAKSVMPKKKSDDIFLKRSGWNV